MKFLVATDGSRGGRAAVRFAARAAKACRRPEILVTAEDGRLYCLKGK